MKSKSVEQSIKDYQYTTRLLTFITVAISFMSFALIAYLVAASYHN